MMSKYKHILYEKKDKIARVKLNRPRYVNAQSQMMLEEKRKHWPWQRASRRLSPF